MRLRNQRTIRRFLLWMAACLPMLMACGQKGPAPGPTHHTVLTGNLSELRSRFNADAGKERAIFLAAPT
ncbi:MAG TPA: hypothetical protein VGM86_33855 [Thermoanaerobaculia bacterium]|jgi:hypothetical protein